MLKLKQAGAIALAGTMIFGLSACGGGKEDAAEATTESGTVTVNTSDTILEGVTVPDNFENMLYPMKALAMENYYLGYDYYVQFADGSSRDSFWYSCALTAKLLNEGDEGTIEVGDEELEQIVSGLYASYQKGNLEYPEIRDGVSFAKYNDDGTSYIFSNNPGDYVSGESSLDQYILTVTSCEETEDGYALEADLEDGESGANLGTYEYTMEVTKYSNGNGNPFVYSISSMYDVNSAYEATEEESSTEATESTEATYDTESTTTTENTESDETFDTEEEEEETYSQTATETEEATEPESTGEITQDEAYDMAQQTYGSSAGYSYQGIENIDGLPYYAYTVDSDELSISYVLVRTTGTDIIGANKNDDGSWSFDQ